MLVRVRGAVTEKLNHSFNAVLRKKGTRTAARAELFAANTAFRGYLLLVFCLTRWAKRLVLRDDLAAAKATFNVQKVVKL